MSRETLKSICGSGAMSGRSGRLFFFCFVESCARPQARQSEARGFTTLSSPKLAISSLDMSLLLKAEAPVLCVLQALHRAGSSIAGFRSACRQIVIKSKHVVGSGRWVRLHQWHGAPGVRRDTAHAFLSCRPNFSSSCIDPVFCKGFTRQYRFQNNVDTTGAELKVPPEYRRVSLDCRCPNIHSKEYRRKRNQHSPKPCDVWVSLDH